MKLTGKQIAVGIKEYLIMAIGMYLYAFGWVACVIPAGGVGGGATGLSILLNHLFPQITMGTFVFIINFILLIIAGFIVGWNFGIKTIYCIVMLSIAMDVCDAVIPENILVKSDLFVCFVARYIEPKNVVKQEKTDEYISIGEYITDS